MEDEKHHRHEEHQTRITSQTILQIPVLFVALIAQTLSSSPDGPCDLTAARGGISLRNRLQ